MDEGAVAVTVTKRNHLVNVKQEMSCIAVYR